MGARDCRRPLFTEFRAFDQAPLHGKSVTEVNALEVSKEHSAVTVFDLYRTPAAGRAAIHFERRERTTDGELTVSWSADSTHLDSSF
ncbi:hypothetical protein RAJCM14343_1999 [Rhodococcus aetherivorans]|uniref:Uncharacterized protein n=1 Tax=Rhodococcus aetherivorans TaxID=191292 RepID=A0ABQ0YJK7_9NOCA|nr:hypothetical protein RAJCM14343_1999 [Rhodococcus aetherivorans]